MHSWKSEKAPGETDMQTFETGWNTQSLLNKVLPGIRIDDSGRLLQSETIWFSTKNQVKYAVAGNFQFTGTNSWDERGFRQRTGQDIGV